MTEQLMIEVLTGPVAALGLCVVCLYAIAKWVGANVPYWVNRHLDQLDNCLYIRRAICKDFGLFLSERINDLFNIFIQSIIIE